MKFMKQVGNGELNLQEQEDEASTWSQEFLSASAKEDSDTLAQAWADEHGANGRLFYSSFLHK